MNIQTITDLFRDNPVSTGLASSIAVGIVINSIAARLAVSKRESTDSRISERVMSEDNEAHVARCYKAEAQSGEAVRLILLGVEIMSPDQVAAWSGVREFLYAYSGGSGAKGPDVAGDDDPRQEGHLRPVPYDDMERELGVPAWEPKGERPF